MEQLLPLRPLLLGLLGLLQVLLLLSVHHGHVRVSSSQGVRLPIPNYLLLLLLGRLLLLWLLLVVGSELLSLVIPFVNVRPLVGEAREILGDLRVSCKRW